MKKRYFVFGFFGYTSNQLDGQTVKTRSIFELFDKKTNGNVSYFDAERFKKNKLSIFLCLFYIIKSKEIIYLPAQNNFKYIFPFIWLFCKLLNKKIHYFVVGGWLPEFINNLTIHRFMLKRTNSIFCETHSMIKNLREWYGLNNVFWFPNFRIHDFKPKISQNNTNCLKLVFMSRIIKSKGYEKVFNLASYFDKNIEGESIIIDFYGTLPSSEFKFFMNGIEKHKNLNYKGLILPQDINKTLTQYDAMLFPTSYIGEGFPGTILDSYVSGIPVIASNWRYNSELIEDRKTGFLFDLENEKQFYEFVEIIYRDREYLKQLKINAYKKSKEFDVSVAWEIIKNQLKI